MNGDLIKILIIESSTIIRSGLSVLLKRIPGYRIQTFELPTLEFTAGNIRLHKPDILIINPVYWGGFDLHKIKSEADYKTFKTIALLTSPVDDSVIRLFDETIGLFDSPELIQSKLDKLFNSNIEENFEEADALSQREKEILTCVVKGMTNKEIAQHLFLSTHTVITHRRNITRKLEIHSTAGLTIFAIVNKLISLDEISKDL